MEDISRTIHALTSMIAVNNNRIKAYQTLEHKTDKDYLKSVCKLHIDQSMRFIQCLSTWRAAYGGFAVANRDSRASNGWVQLKSMLDFSLRRSLWKQCEDQEKAALRIYESALRNSFIPGAAREDIQDQAKGFEKALATFKHFSDQPPSTHQVAFQQVENRWR
jgi:hypothetical protein